MDYDVAVVGAGASGTALAYVLARYAGAKRIALIEKYGEVGSVNSNVRNNSQTLHVGDIETNYTIEKARQVAPAAMMVKRYTDSLPPDERAQIIQPVHKMVLGVGAREVEFLKDRYPNLKEIFPDLRLLDAGEVAQAEPEVMKHRLAGPVAAIANDGYAVDFGNLARSLISHAQKTGKVDMLLKREVAKISKKDGDYVLHTNSGDVLAKTIVVDADAYSLGLAKSMGLGKEFSLIPIAGSFYFSPQKLRGKVYTVQEPRMPFAAVHGDPDLTREHATRWGPTARFYPVLEARKFSSAAGFFASSGLHRPQTWISFATILLDPLRFWYLLKNFFYDLPVVGVHIFLPQVQKIVPTMRAADLEWAKGYGGMRLQRVDTRTRELLLGEGKITGDKIIFNMTPSPGASVCLYNAMRDAEVVAQWLDVKFDKEKLLSELWSPVAPCDEQDVSLRDTYAS